MKELYVEVREDEVDGGYTASAIGYGIHTQGETKEELRNNILDAVDCYFGDQEDSPKVIRIRTISEEVLVR
jgi:predicted RNase H-like HicB family nuclease